MTRRMVTVEHVPTGIGGSEFEVRKLNSLNPESRTPNHFSIDPENRLLSHMPIRRLEAEAIRDSMLACQAG